MIELTKGQKISLAKKGKVVISEKQKEQIRAKLTGREVPREIVQKMIATKRRLGQFGPIISPTRKTKCIECSIEFITEHPNRMIQRLVALASPVAKA